MSGYGALAACYDRLTADVDYDGRAAYFASLLRRHGGSERTLLLDLACGTGNLTAALAKRGAEMIGVDLSDEMLAEAEKKREATGAPILYLRQDMRELDLYGTVGAAVCSLDGMNHLCTAADATACLARLSLFIEPGGLFVFDVNTPYKHREILRDNTFVLEDGDIFCVWRNRFFPRVCEVTCCSIFLSVRDPFTEGRRIASESGRTVSRHGNVCCGKPAFRRWPSTRI